MQPTSNKWEQASQLIQNEIERFRVLVEADRIVAAAYLCQVPMQIGSACVDLGYIGQVAVRPGFQFQGRGSLLIQDLVDCLNEQDFDLARLSGLVRFYERFGWKPFPRRFVEFPLQDLKAGMAHVSLEHMARPSPTAAQRIREYCPDTDRQRRDTLVRQFNYLRTGACVREVVGRSRPLHQERPDQWQLVYEEQGEILAYVASHVFPYDVSDFESSVNLYDVAFNLNHPQAVVDLLKHVLWAAHQRGASRVTARLPWDRRLFAILRQAGLVFEKVELNNAATGNMLRIVSLRRLLDKIASELTVRWRSAGLRKAGVLTIRVDEKVTSLRCDVFGVRVVDTIGDMCWNLHLDAVQFCRLLLGMNPPESLLSASEIGSDAFDVVRVLFPAQATASTNWG